MKKYYILFFALYLVFQLQAQPSKRNSVIISEIMYDSPLNEQIGKGIPYSNGEYIELYNLGEEAVDLTGWRLTGGGVTEKYDFPENTILAPRSCILVVYQYYNSEFLLRDLFQEIDLTFPNAIILYQRKIILSNAGETVSLINDTGRVVDYITYDGTSNSSKTNRLSAPNENGLVGWNCDALVRTEVVLDAFKNVIFDPAHWGIGLSPNEAFIRTPFDQPTQDENYILETTYTNPDAGTDVVTYYDKLGRPSQTILVGASPVGRQNIVSFVQYDKMGRNDVVSYLQYAAPSQSRAIRPYPLDEQQAFYRNRYAYDQRGTDGNYAFASKEYDSSGLGVVLKQGGPGRSHQLDMHPTEYEYGSNGRWGPIKRYAVADNGDLVYLGLYADQQLMAKATLQPTEGNEKNISIEYYEPNGNLVAQEQHVSLQDRRITYYVFDDLGRQRYVLPPSVDITATTCFDDLTDLCFYTEYDEYGRVFKHYVPGASYTLSLYDNWGRLALSQDGEQRKTEKWSYTKYDILNRPVISGIFTGGSCEFHKVEMQIEGSPYVFRNNSIHGYTDGCYPLSTDDADVLTVTYYDDYEWMENKLEYAFRLNLALDDTPDYNVKGLMTGKKIKVLDADAPQWLTSVTYYDDKYQIIHTIGDLYPRGKEYVSNAYDYKGNVIEARVIQCSSDEFEYRKWFSYDAQGRLLSVDQQVIGDDENGLVTVASYEYDELGRNIEKELHNSYETCSSDYDISGANTRTNSSLFGCSVWTSMSYDATPPRYDGKPVHFDWHRPNGDEHGYKYSYDRMGQLAAAQYVEYSAEDQEWLAQSNFNERDFLYDKNGNIEQLLRTDENGEPMHDMTYTYSGNQLSELTKNGVKYRGYTYDLCGNLTYDPVEELHFEYNDLNLPCRIFGNGGEVRYIYDAEGRKLATLADGSFTYYRSVMVYSGVTEQGDDRLIYMLHPEGLIAAENGRYSYKYHLTDYTGNVRAVAFADNSIGRLIEEQRTDYYPFGLAHSYNNLHKNRYLFSGKELQDYSLGRSGLLNLYDFGSRYYNPMHGRWFNTDPALQTTNPYLFCGNAPMVYTDPNGEFFFSAILPGIGTLIDAACWGAVAGAASYTASVAFSDGGFNNWSWGNFGKSMGFGALSGVATAGVGDVIGGSGTFVNELGRGVAHGMVQGGISTMGGGDFMSGFASGALGSWAGSAFGATKFGQSRVGMYGFSGVAGGLGSLATGGDFFQGATIGLMNAGLNHLRHGVNTFMNKKKAVQYMWENSFNASGVADYENFAWETEDGTIIVLPNNKNTPSKADPNCLPLRSKNGRLQVLYGRWRSISRSIHTHPINVSSGIGISNADILMLKSSNIPMQVIYDQKLYNVWGKSEYEQVSF